MVGAVALNFASVRTDHVLQTVQGPPVVGMWGGRESDGTILNLATPGSAYVLPMSGLIARLTAQTEFVWKCKTRAGMYVQACPGRQARVGIRAVIVQVILLHIGFCKPVTFLQQPLERWMCRCHGIRRGLVSVPPCICVLHLRILE